MDNLLLNYQESMPPVLRGEMLLDRMGGGQARLNYEQLRQDAQDLELQIKQLQVLLLRIEVMIMMMIYM